MTGALEAVVWGAFLAGMIVVVAFLLSGPD